MILKICGITNQQDASAAVSAGATAIGFNFYPRSPRYLAAERAAEIVTPAGVLRVGVFVNEPRARVEEIARIAGLHVAQLHGEETPADYPRGCGLEASAGDGRLSTSGAPTLGSGPSQCTHVALAVWKALRVDEHFDLAAYQDCPAQALLLDGPAAGLYGGAGLSFDWRRARQNDRKIILAGGLDASNVARAIELARPWGVDTCSRIESAPGQKDHRKMNEFLQAAMAAACR